MEIGIVEYGGNLSNVFEEIISSKVGQSFFKKKKALDVFDVLAFTKKFIDMDQVVVIVELKRDEKEENKAFFEALARLEADTGKNIFKAIYYDDEDGKASVEELAEKFVNYLFYPEKLKEEKKKEGEFDWLGG